jgi:hypothetical protein
MIVNGRYQVVQGRQRLNRCSRIRSGFQHGRVGARKKKGGSERRGFAITPINQSFAKAASLARGLYIAVQLGTCSAVRTSVHIEEMWRLYYSKRMVLYLLDFIFVLSRLPVRPVSLVLLSLYPEA